MGWITPISDRTLTDVIYAKNNRGNDSYNKGALNPDYDLNRIEGNCEYLSARLNSYGYKVNITAKADWTENDFPTLIEINRIRDNVNTLIEDFNKMDGSPDIKYSSMLNYEDMNSLEQNLKNMNELLEKMIATFWHSGEIYGGER